MPDLHENKVGNTDPKGRQLTIGLGSALDGLAEADEINNLISNQNR